jgi:hypothetical protein
VKFPGGSAGNAIAFVWRLVGRSPRRVTRKSLRRYPVRQGAHLMMDILMLVLAAGFFALAIGYTYACERL